MKRTESNENVKKVVVSRVKVPHIGPRPRSSGPGTVILGSKKRPFKTSGNK